MISEIIAFEMFEFFITHTPDKKTRLTGTGIKKNFLIGTQRAQGPRRKGLGPRGLGTQMASGAGPKGPRDPNGFRSWAQGAWGLRGLGPKGPMGPKVDKGV